MITHLPVFPLPPGVTVVLWIQCNLVEDGLAFFPLIARPAIMASCYWDTDSALNGLRPQIHCSERNPPAAYCAGQNVG